MIIHGVLDLVMFLVIYASITGWCVIGGIQCACYIYKVKKRFLHRFLFILICDPLAWFGVFLFIIAELITPLIERFCKFARGFFFE
jgi:hypothetical protein